MVRGIRGATTSLNTVSDITKDTNELITLMVETNNVDINDIVSIIFTMTDDLDAVYPAKAVREIGFDSVTLMCFQELKIENSLKSCIRVLMTINTEKTNQEIKHVYLNGAKILRPDLS